MVSVIQKNLDQLSMKIKRSTGNSNKKGRHKILTVIGDLTEFDSTHLEEGPNLPNNL